MDIMNTVKAIIILDIDGKRALARYFDERINSKQFERQIFVKTKTHRTKDEILMVDGYLVIHRFVTDLHMFVVGSKNENPLILDRILCCLVEVVTTLLNRNVEHRSMLENLDQIILAFDEICDGGIVMETDPNLVLQRVCLKDDIAEQSMARVFQSATENLKFPWIRS